MPKKVTPRWGEPDINNVKVPSFTLNDEQVAQLGRHLGLTARERLAQLKATLERIGARHLLWIQQDEKGPRRAEQNAGLKQVSASPDELASTVTKLDCATQARLLDVLWTHPCIKFRGGEQLDKIARDAPDMVVDAARLALGQKRCGPAPRKTLPMIIRWLASIYEETTDLKFTHTPYEKTKYNGTPQSQAGQFVTAFLKMVDPKLPETAIAPEMARFVETREGRYKLSN